ncbi:putative carbbohydrate responsive phospholipase [Haloarcula marismortui ATCC 43049]|uniref:Phospholipase n=2 Tax=Haloarcula marismortui TaxID=2238 RepID=Q5UWP4_HALMA|nr:putative carbbohydrate responsive phospholipase [Haloarcula marismortui ATCC 43049]QCP89848.1 phospholipase [Haloarcula marismortui ATCC 43049]
MVNNTQNRRHTTDEQVSDRNYPASRRAVLQPAGLAVGGTALGGTVMTHTTTAESSFETKTWQTDAVPETPVRELSFPGTHHAAMVTDEPDSPEYYDCQTRDVYTQLSDGIRFLDVRVESQGDGDGTVFYGHHADETGQSLDETVFPKIAQYLSAVDNAGASELILLKLSHFYDSGAFSDDAFEADDWEALSTLLTDTFGAYAFDLGAVGGTDALLDATLSEFDGPKIAIFYRTLTEHDDPVSLPDFTAPWAGWVASSYPDTATPGDVLANGVRNDHTETDRLGETQWIIRAPTDLYSGAQQTNAMLPLYEQVVSVAPELNPNLIRVDYYETSDIVPLCRRLSVAGLDGTSDTPPISEGVYSVHSVETGNVIEITDGDTSDGASVVEADWTESDHQRFSIQPTGDGTYRLDAVHSGKVLDVENEGTDDAVDIIQWPWTGNANQRWYAVSVGDDRYAFINKHSGRVLDGEQPGANVHQWHWEGDPNQQWTLHSR